MQWPERLAVAIWVLAALVIWVAFASLSQNAAESIPYAALDALIPAVAVWIVTRLSTFVIGRRVR